MFDVTRERIRQIEAKAMKKLMHPLRQDKLRLWLREDQPRVRPTAEVGDPEMPAKDAASERGEATREAQLDNVALKASADAAMPVPRQSALDRALTQAAKLGVAVEHTLDGEDGTTWVYLTEPQARDSRNLAQSLIFMGFECCPGKGYWR